MAWSSVFAPRARPGQSSADTYAFFGVASTRILRVRPMAAV